MDAAKAQKRYVKQFRARFQDRPYVPLGKAQEASRRDPGVHGPVWIAYAPIRAPSDNDLRDLLWEHVEELNVHSGLIHKPEYGQELWGEWMGARTDGLDTNEPGPVKMQSLQKTQSMYQNIMRDVKTPLTTLFFQGGSFIFGSPVVARSLVSKVCHQTGGRSYSIAYRVGPQHTFPAFLLDGLVAYFSLLSPPPNAPHQPVPASSLVLAGESAGAALCLAIVKFLLGLRHSLAKRNRPLYIRFNGRDVPLDLPAGLALHSIFAETLVKLPSTVKFYYPDFISGGPPYFQPDYPADSTWPTNPPRAEVYVDASALLHPLLCLCTVTDWRGCPPMFVSFGEERLADSNLIIAQQAARQGVVVRLLQYEYMPHVFAWSMSRLPQSAHCVARLSRAMIDFATGKPGQSSAKFVFLGDLREEEKDVNQLIGLDPESALKTFEPALPAKVASVWRGPTVTKVESKSIKPRM